MATTSTARLQLLKPTPGTGEKVLVQADLNDNWDKIDLLGKKASPITLPFIKRNTLDTINSATQSVLETLTVVLKTNHWYDIISSFRSNSTVAINTAPTGSAEIKYKLGASVAITDPPVARASILNCTTANPRTTFGNTFDVPADGTYTFGLCVDSGGAGNTLNISASGGPDNTGFDRGFWIKDLGEK